jgi:circadian clock protein KaiC|nr:ATPase domain-containing protein [uncultured Pseudomonas sp.]
MKKVAIKSLSTGIPGLDRVLVGGLPEFSFNVIAGAPGCGKTTLAHQLMFEMAKNNAPALYFTVLGEPPLKMLRHQQQFDFFDEQKIGQSIHFINLAEEAFGGDLKVVLQRIVDEVRIHQPKLLFVDSFPAVVLASEAGQQSHNHRQRFMQQLSQLLTSWQITSFLIGEYFNEAVNKPVFTVADGLIWLRQSVQRNAMVRKLEIMKMRGKPILPGLHTYRITSHKGIQVFAPSDSIEPPEVIRAPVYSRLAMGVAHLDEMLGGGLPSGYTLLVVGPSGSGKSVLATAFLAEGIRNGETAVIANFEQNPYLSRNPALVGLLNSGQVGVLYSLAPDLSIEELTLKLVDEVRRLKATRVVIDSLSGFELSLAPTFRADFRESLARLIRALSNIGVSVLLISELEDSYTELRLSLHRTAFLADAIIMQRYIEVESRLLRVMSVVKVRGSRHSNQLRQYVIDDEGIHIGATLTDQEGLLGGQPAASSGDDSA